MARLIKTISPNGIVDHPFLDPDHRYRARYFAKCETEGCSNDQSSLANGDDDLDQVRLAASTHVIKFSHSVQIFDHMLTPDPVPVPA